ncbi:non-reducing end alpha-L-arabinofuranosidase family hydrolase [Marinactinospora rubrisoli]|uniref:non-reducing end alpha-L-arabinofuranosidase n=1 Tax=Marinactinospora rubrisoli TaxID=2715399 RepID=A0ABW2KLN0_9ACTN
MTAPRRRHGVAALAAVAVLSSTTLAPAEAATALPTEFQWSSSDVLISPQPDAQHDIVSIKDPTVVHHDGRWHVFATTADTAGSWSLTYTAFETWEEAATAPQRHLDTTPIGPGYRAAPQVFYFAPQQTWYLVFQSPMPTYSTTTDISDPDSWSAPRTFQDEVPPIVEENRGDGTWLDFWVICDTANCYLFSSDDNGHLYRARTSVADFPEGFTDTRIALEDSRFALFEASNVYQVADSGEYLLLVEAIGATGRRYFRSWTSDAIDGAWTPLAATENAPFAGAANVTFPGGRWTEDISHGEMVRAGIDQTMRIDPCGLRYLYQGMDPASSGDYSQLPWRLGLLTQTGSGC